MTVRVQVAEWVQIKQGLDRLEILTGQEDNIIINQTQLSPLGDFQLFLTADQPS